MSLWYFSFSESIQSFHIISLCVQNINRNWLFGASLIEGLFQLCAITSTGRPRYMWSFYQWFCLYAIENRPFLRNLSLNLQASLVFLYANSLYAILISWSLSLAFNEVRLYCHNFLIFFQGLLKLSSAKESITIFTRNILSRWWGLESNWILVF